MPDERRIPGTERRPQGKYMRAGQQRGGEGRKMDGIRDRRGVECDAGVVRLGVMVVRYVGLHQNAGKRCMVDTMREARPLREQQHRREQECKGGAELRQRSRSVHGTYFADTGVASVRR